MRVLQILNRFNLGGPTPVVAHLVKYLPCETLLVAGHKDASEADSEGMLAQLGIRPHYVPHMGRSINPTDDLKAWQYLRTLIKNFRPDVVHTHAAKAGLLGRTAAKVCRVPVIVHTFHGHVFHSYFSPMKTNAIIQAERTLARFTDAVIAITPRQKEELAHRFRIAPERKIHTIPHAFDFAPFTTDQEAKRTAFRRKYAIPDEAVVVSIIGRIVPVKNHSLFLQAVHRIREKGKMMTAPPEIRFLIIGDGGHRAQIEAQAKDLLLTEPFLTFTSWIFPIDEAIAGTDIIALTSHNEGSPVSLVEAQAASRPVVATRVGGVPDTVWENESAFIVPANDAEAFAEALWKLITDSDLRAKMGAQGRLFVERQFHYLKRVEETYNLYEQILFRKHHKRH
jgi:glycosyltransferase involved in cell wall biosynthesis